LWDAISAVSVKKFYAGIVDMLTFDPAGKLFRYMQGEALGKSLVVVKITKGRGGVH
jgi:hypothetical protein